MTEPIRDTAHSLLAVARNAVELAKAELQLAASEARASASKFTAAAALVYLSLVFLQIALLLVSLIPILLGSQSWQRVVASVAIPSGGALLSGLGAWLSLRRHKARVKQQKTISQLQREPKRARQ